MPDSTYDALRSRIDARRAVVGVVGLGYVGLPLVHAFIEAGFRVLGYDVDQAKVDRLQRGESYIGHIPSAWLASWLAAERFDATAGRTRARTSPT
jgi:UDP-N-acetyl-D-glucosamine dehydrogenase